MSELGQDERLEEVIAQLEADGDDENRVDATESGNGGATRGIGLIATFFALIAAGLAGYAAYVAWQLQQSQPELKQRLLGMDTRISGVDSRLGQLATWPDPAGLISTLRKDLVAQLRRSDEVASARLSEGLKRLEEQVGTTSQDWLLAESEFLVRMAHHRLEMQKDVEGAIALLQAADDVVRHAELPRGFAIRQAIASDVAVLELVPSVDTAGYFLRIAALDNQIARLREKNPSFESGSSARPSREQADGTGLSATLLGYASRAGDYIGDQFEFRRGHEPIRPLMLQTERYYLEQNLRLQLQTARLALLGQDQVVYVTSLSQAADWVMSYFDPDDAVTQKLQVSLRELARATVSSEIPRIGDSLTAIRAALVDFDDEPRRRPTASVQASGTIKAPTADQEPTADQAPSGDESPAAATGDVSDPGSEDDADLQGGAA